MSLFGVLITIIVAFAIFMLASWFVHRYAQTPLRPRAPDTALVYVNGREVEMRVPASHGAIVAAAGKSGLGWAVTFYVPGIDRRGSANVLDPFDLISPVDGTVFSVVRTRAA